MEVTAFDSSMLAIQIASVVSMLKCEKRMQPEQEGGGKKTAL